MNQLSCGINQDPHSYQLGHWGSLIWFLVVCWVGLESKIKVRNGMEDGKEGIFQND